jgi:hypothetical protein
MRIPPTAFTPGIIWIAQFHRLDRICGSTACFDNSADYIIRTSAQDHLPAPDINRLAP